MALNEVTLLTGAWLNGVHGTCAETAAFHVAPAMQQTKCAPTTPFPWILIRALRGYRHSFRITCDMCAVSLLESREQRYIKPMSNNTRSESRFGLAVRRYRLVSGRTSGRYLFGSLFSSKVVVCGHCPVTLSIAVNETL